MIVGSYRFRVGNKCGLGRGSGVTEIRGDDIMGDGWGSVRVQTPLINAVPREMGQMTVARNEWA